ncbi:MAG: hypothetical protein P1U82_30300 [Verrucomicrobiales bacterium]|nr:hypothetical protein [Verrucomicrobiales bacterium]MDF1790189.1 hypothetical protein [Verrucomicrobiales bacterium]
MNLTTQGLYTISPSGDLLAFNNNRGHWKVKKQLTEALKHYSPNKAAQPLKVTKADPQYQAIPPKGTIIARAHVKVLGGYEKTDDSWREIFQKAVSRDNLWITPKEQKALARGEFTGSLTQRLVRYHLVDNTRGEPTFWKPKDVKQASLKVDIDGNIRGKVRLARSDGSSGYEANLVGQLSFTDGKLSRFDLVAVGDYWGGGRYTRKPPEGRFPVGVSFRLPAKPTSFDLIPPQGTKGWMDPYLFTTTKS